LANECPNTVFRGIDSHPKQVARYNDEAAKLFGEEHYRMYAMIGDLSKPSPALDQTDWQDFDVAIISMALHHVPEPIEMLMELRKRLKTGGTLTVVEMIETNHEAANSLNQEDMIEAIGGEKIWPGFTPRGLGVMLEKAGFTDVEARVPDLWFDIPAHVTGSPSAQRKQLMFVKANNGRRVIRNEL
jgi:SAM-dependent methyltransferase